MIKEHFQVLETLIESGHSKDINIHYNTNGTQLPKHEYHNILPHFKHCRISFSIDDIGDKFEYQRYGAKWDEVNNNIQYISGNKPSNIETEICTTLNLFNFHNLPDVADWIKEIKNLDSWYLNLMHYPLHYNIQMHTPEIKNIIANKLRAYNWQELIDRKFDNVKEIDSFINYMHSTDLRNIKDDEDHTDRMLTDTARVDSMRTKTLNEVDPVLSEYIGYEYNKCLPPIN